MAADPDRPTEGRGLVVGAARIVAGLTVLSRLFGLIRDAVCSRVFGAGPVWSAFAFAFLLPNLTRRLFGEGALTGAFIPEYARLLAEDEAAAGRYASAMLGIALGVVTLFTLLVEAALLALLLLTPLGESGRLALTLAMVLIPFAPMICAVALVGGVLQTHGRFAPTAAAPIILNVCIIGGVLGWTALGDGDLEDAAFSAAWAVLLAGVLQLLWSLAAARRHAVWTTSLAGVAEPVRRSLRRTGPVIVGLGALQINTLLDGVIASYPILVGPSLTVPGLGAVDYPLDEASNATLFFASRLYQFPLGVFGIALATAVFPMLARQARQAEAFTETLRDGLRLTLFIGLPASVGLVLVRTDLTAAILAGGRFGASDVARVSAVLLGYAPAVWAYAMNHTLTRAFYARGDTATPMRVTLGFVGLNIALNLGLIWSLGEAGLAWSTAACSIGQFAMLSILWKRQGLGPVGSSELLGSAAWTIGLTGVMAGGVLIAQALMPTGDAWSTTLWRLLAAVAVGGAVYGGLALAAGRPEPRWLLARRRRSQENSEEPTRGG